VQRIRKEQPIGRAGGVYIPPHKLAEMNKAAGQDKSSKEYQRMTWEALRKSINGLINKVCLHLSAAPSLPSSASADVGTQYNILPHSAVLR